MEDLRKEEDRTAYLIKAGIDLIKMEKIIKGGAFIVSDLRKFLGLLEKEKFKKKDDSKGIVALELKLAQQGIKQDRLRDILSENPTVAAIFRVHLQSLERRERVIYNIALRKKL